MFGWRSHVSVAAGLIVLISGLWFVPSVHADAPNLIVYQGKLTDLNGSPISAGSANMVFELYDALSAGTCRWSNSSSICASATTMSVSLSDGLFTVYLGSSGMASIPDELFVDYPNLYLKVTVNGDALSPRKQIGASAYALSAQAVSGANNETIVNSIDGRFDVSGHVVPSTNNLFTLGSSSLGWDELYLSHPTSGTAIALSAAGSSLTTSGASLIGVNGSATILCSTVQECVSERTFDDIFDVSVASSNATLEIDGTTNLQFDLTSTGDVEFLDNGTSFVGIKDTGVFSIGLLDNDPGIEIVNVGSPGMTTGTALQIAPSALTTGIGISLVRSDNATDYSNTTQGLLYVDMKDVASTGYVANVQNAGTGSTLRVASSNASANVAVNVAYASGTLQPGAGAGLYLLASSDSLSLSSSSASRRGALVQIETNSESGGGSPDTFNYIAFNEDINGIPDAKWRVDQSGATSADGAYSSTGADYAEFFPSDDLSLSAGEVVVLNAQTGSVARASSAQAENIFGVISTNPSFIGNNFTGAEFAVPEIFPNYKLVALLGQVPVQVSDENGPIAVGDYLTSSSTPGHAMRASDPGVVLGQALESFTGAGTGMIRVFISRQWRFNKGAEFTETVEATGNRPLAEKFFSVRGRSLQVEQDMYAGGDLVFERPDQQVRLSFLPATDQRGSTVFTNAQTWQSTGHGFAEVFDASEQLLVGEAAELEESGLFVRRARGGRTKPVIGIVSATAGVVTGNMTQEQQYAIILQGKTKAFVKTSAGPIQPGDALRVDLDQFGVLQKATGEGMIVGFALGSSSEDASNAILIDILVQPGWNADLQVSGQHDVLENFVAGSSVRLGEVFLEGDLYLGGHRIINVRGLQGLKGAWSIEEDGTFRTKRNFSVDLTNPDLPSEEAMEGYAMLSFGEKVSLSGSGQLVNGLAMIGFDPIDPRFSRVISDLVPLKVLVTLTGEAKGVFVVQKTINWFTVQETQGGTSNATFDWYVEGYRRARTEGAEPIPSHSVVAPIVPVALPVDSIETMIDATPETTEPSDIEPGEIPEPEDTLVPAEPIQTPERQPETPQVEIVNPNGEAQQGPLPENTTWIFVPEIAPTS